MFSQSSYVTHNETTHKCRKISFFKYVDVENALKQWISLENYLFSNWFVACLLDCTSKCILVTYSGFCHIWLWKCCILNFHRIHFFTQPLPIASINVAVLLRLTLWTLTCLYSAVPLTTRVSDTPMYWSARGPLGFKGLNSILITYLTGNTSFKANHSTKTWFAVTEQKYIPSFDTKRSKVPITPESM